MITSSVLNSVTFKYLNGSYPNKWNTLHADRKQAGFTVVPYCQKFNKNDVVYLQFTSDSNTLPELKIYIPHLNDTITATLASSYSGLDDRYFFNYSITLDSDYYDKKIYFTVEQDGDTLTSEPIYCEDLTESINKGYIKRVKYNNLDRNYSDLSNYWVDWSVIDYMYFYIESVDINPLDQEEVEVLEGSQSKKIIAANNFSGINLQTDGIPDYLILKLKAASSLDFFEVNEVQYIKDGEVGSERKGNSTLHNATINLTEKNTIGLNVDDIGVVLTDTDMAIIVKKNVAVTSSGWQLENTEGYMLHSVQIRHALTSAGNAVVNLGTAVAGEDLIDDVQGTINLADYPSTGKYKSFPLHYLKDSEAYNIYFTVTGAGAVLEIIVNLDTITES